MKPDWKGSREQLLAQVIALVDRFMRSDRISIAPPLFNQDPLRRRILLALNINKIVQHVWQAIHFENTEALEPIFDDLHPVRSTEDMAPWYTGRACQPTGRSHINFCVFDSAWEATEAYQLDKSPHVQAWVKNDHLGFEVLYIFKGVRRKYRPDFLVKSASGTTLVLEVKGQTSEEELAKRKALDQWVKAVNTHGGFGEWCSAVSRNPMEVVEVLDKVSRASGLSSIGR